MKTLLRPLHWSRFFWASAAVWTLLAVGWFAFSYLSRHDRIMELVRNQARVVFEKDVLMRRWASELGGVYGPVTPRTPPNPYLKGLVPERDLTTPAGRKLTLLNPAYITRQVHEFQAMSSDIRGHITSLNPIRPENRADDWETRALEQFEKGEKEVATRTILEGRSYFRLMKPFYVEQSCLTCHAAQGYRLGQVRGGISVSVPLAAFENQSRSAARKDLASVGVIWLMGVLGLGWAFARLNQADKLRAASEVGRENAVRELKKSNQDLEEFSSHVAHDLKSPLATLEGYAHLAFRSSGASHDPKLREQLDTILSSSVRMREIVDDLLDLARAGHAEMHREEMDLTGMVRETWKSLTDREQERPNRLDVEEGLRAYGDPRFVQLVLTNLLGNAWKYSGKSPEVRVEVGVDPQKSGKPFFIRDHGVGFDSARAVELFQPFHRLHEKTEFKGTGLGLCVVWRVVERHGGRVWAESKIGEGAVFYFTLPQDGGT